jgi:hypothetical protein
LPQLVAYARTHRIPLITIANDRSFDDVDRFLRERSLLVDVLLDRDGKFGRANHADKLPTTLIYDARGNVKERFTGAQDWRAVILSEAKDLRMRDSSVTRDSSSSARLRMTVGALTN